MKQNGVLLLLVSFLFLACQKETTTQAPSATTPLITSLSFRGDTLHIVGQWGPLPDVSKAVVINNETVPTDRIIDWKKEEVTVLVEEDLPVEKEVQVTVNEKKSNKKTISKAAPQVPAPATTLRMDYLQVAEPDGRLYIHGQFGADPGPAHRGITVEQVTNHVVRTPINDIVSWTNNLIVCRIPNTGPGSHGVVFVRVNQDSVYRGLYQYNFVLGFNRPQGGASGSLAEQVRFQVWLRGDGDVAPDWVQPLNLSTNLHDESKAVWEGSGEGRSSYNNIDGCASIFVQWQATTGTEFVQPNDAPFYRTGWRSFVTHKRDGFDLKIDFNALNVIPSKITLTPCVGNATVQERKESILFDEFEDQTIHLKVSKEYISAGELTKSGLSSSAGLHWDASVFQQQLVTARLSWNRNQGKLD